MQELKDLEQDALNIASLGNHLLEAIKERDKKIKKINEINGEYFYKLENALKENQELKLRLEEIGRV
jgi:hypothetical protein